MDDRACDERGEKSMTKKDDGVEWDEGGITKRSDNEQIKAILDTELVDGVTGLLGGSKRLVQAVFLGWITLGTIGNCSMFCKI